MAKYRKKPVVIEAVLFDGREFGDYGNFVPADRVTFVQSFLEHEAPVLEIHTLEGTMRADVGDWIIKGVKGEFYPIKDEIFRETYEAVDDAA